MPAAPTTWQSAGEEKLTFPQAYFNRTFQYPSVELFISMPFHLQIQFLINYVYALYIMLNIQFWIEENEVEGKTKKQQNNKKKPKQNYAHT